MKILLLAIPFVALGGCATTSTGAVSAGPDTFVVSRQAGAFPSGRELNAEADSTKVALNDFNRPNVTITVPKVNEYYLAQLLYMLEVQTAFAGGLYGIDAFNQPGVEQAKNYTYALMGRKGYETTAVTLKEKMSV